MPFSMAEVQKYSQSILQFYIKIPYKKMKKIVTLQVRILAVYLHKCAHCHSRKAFLSASFLLNFHLGVCETPKPA